MSEVKMFLDLSFTAIFLMISEGVLESVRPLGAGLVDGVQVRLVGVHHRCNKYNAMRYYNQH